MRSCHVENRNTTATIMLYCPAVILSCLAGTCLQQDTIDVLVSNNMVQIAIELLQTHLDLQPVAENAIAMVPRPTCPGMTHGTGGGACPV